MSKFQRTVKGNFNTIANQLHQDITASGVSITLKDEHQYTINGVQIFLRVYDKYYARSSSRTSLTLQIVGQGETVGVCAITAGGGNGAFFSFSLGAEENFLSVVSDSMRNMGYY
ncbi:MAG: DUF6054 family protein [Oscillospiraceae bacterium]